ncbi:HEX2 protein-like protein [Drechmeria coniospora]|uniref:HEX2 protein-like protein n=1 Tax=Drechmeria coniospora TaxID=98403 RepID=A0A151GG02_DRECN|nr:HEX2 protein-like protein [Drechmeria coniospora]KYK56033.1 HEX2 protein-like protein [Drechmeria coniospora]
MQARSRLSPFPLTHHSHSPSPSSSHSPSPSPSPSPRANRHAPYHTSPSLGLFEALERPATTVLITSADVTYELLASTEALLAPRRRFPLATSPSPPLSSTMAAVLPSENISYFSTSLRRSQSQSHLSGDPTSFHSHADITHSYASSKSYADSEHSSAPSSPLAIQAESTDVSFISTPASNLSISSDYDETLALDDALEEQFSLPMLSQDKFFVSPQIHHDDSLEPPPSPKAADSCTLSPPDADNSLVGSGSDTPDCVEHAEDDTAIVSRPSRQVDYLSHNWREEDIWSSWRYIVSRREQFPNSTRLENASWRTWMKAKNKLKTISPEELNWLKDCDVTWLYGPLQSGSNHLHPTQTEPSSSMLSKSDSLVNLNKKPILKKRSMSEIMLQRSLTASSLLKQATAAVHAQETGILRPNLSRANTDCYVTFPLSTRRVSCGNTGSVTQSTTDSSGVSSPYPESKHIHFNDKVEQCIAVEVKGDDDDDDDMELELCGDDSESDDGVMMKRVRSKKRGPSTKRRSKKAAQPEGKTIAMLPSTTLKYREDTPEPPETAMKHSSGIMHSPLLSPSSSQETLRPSKQSAFYFGADDDDSDEAAVTSTSGWRSPSSGGICRSNSNSSLADEPAGMRRTPSGMLMPCDDGEAPIGDGIMGRVIDTVNTARDIAHVIWNVGWRK